MKLREAGTSRRWVAVTMLVVSSPVCAEYLAAYLSSTGNLLDLLAGLVIFIPLYGGAALLIREVGIRTGRNWVATMLFAAAFGVAMTGVIDLSLYTEHRSDVTDWDSLVNPTRLDVLNVNAGIGLAWVLGHVIMSICVPVALTHGLAPALRRTRWLNTPALVITAVVWMAVATLVHQHERGSYGAQPTSWHYVAALAVIALLIGLAMSRLGHARPATSSRKAPHVWRCMAVGAVVALATMVTSAGWAWVAGTLVVLILAGWWLARSGRSVHWTQRHVVGVAAGAMVSSALLAFASPAPPDVSEIAKLAHNTVIAATAIALFALALKRTAHAGNTNAAAPRTHAGRAAEVRADVGHHTRRRTARLSVRVSPNPAAWWCRSACP